MAKIQTPGSNLGNDDAGLVLDFLRENKNIAYSAYEIMNTAPGFSSWKISWVLIVLDSLEYKGLITETSRGNGLKRWKIV